MPNLTGFTVYQTFVAVKNHFTRKDYDFVKYNGRTTTTMNSYLKRKDRFFFEKIARHVSAENMVDHIVGNMVAGDNGLQIDPQKVWVGTLATQQGIDSGLAYMKKKQAIEYLFKKDLTIISECATISDGNTQFPTLLNLYYEGKISPETLIIIDAISGIFKFWDEDRLAGDPLWNKTGFFLRKYQRLALTNIQQDIEKYRIFAMKQLKNDTI